MEQRGKAESCVFAIPSIQNILHLSQSYVLLSKPMRMAVHPRSKLVMTLDHARFPISIYEILSAKEQVAAHLEDTA